MAKYVAAAASSEPAVQPLRVLIVDDSVDFVESAVHFLSLEVHIKIIGVASSGLEALTQVAELRPDLVLMDVQLKDMSGLEVTRRIKAQPRAPWIIIVTILDTSGYRVAASAVHADGFVAKAEFGTELLPLIRLLCVARASAS